MFQGHYLANSSLFMLIQLHLLSFTVIRCIYLVINLSAIPLFFFENRNRNRKQEQYFYIW